MQEGAFKIVTTVIAIIGVIVAIFAWRYPVLPERPDQPPPVETKNTPVSVNIFDKEPLYTISSGTNLKVSQDIYLPANEDVLYIQKGKFILNKEDVNEYDYLVILKLNEASRTIRKIPSGKHLEITESDRYGPEDREYRHAYVYLKVDNEDIDYLKCIGKDSSEYITIGQFKNIMKGIIDVNIPMPKEI